MGELSALLRNGADVEAPPLRQPAATVGRLPVPTEEGGVKADAGSEAAIEGQTHEAQRQLPAQAEAIKGYHAEAVELINANVNATLDYVWRLAEVRSPAEFIVLSTKQACRHFELIMTQAATLGVFSHSLYASPNARDAEDS
jgi:hypothetical protein